MTICSNNLLKAAFLISNAYGCADDLFSFNHSQSNNFQLFLTFMRGSEIPHVLELRTSEYTLKTLPNFFLCFFMKSIPVSQNQEFTVRGGKKSFCLMTANVTVTIEKLRFKPQFVTDKL